jgi:DNA-binding NarL/FixJ family response regulator
MLVNASSNALLEMARGSAAPEVDAVLTMTAIGIVEDNPTIRAGLEELVSGLRGCRCVGAFGSAEEALRKLPALKPELVLMDINLPNLSGIECTARLKELLPAARVLMLTVYEDEERIFQALQAGASGYILKRTGKKEIVEAIHELRRGGAPMTSAIARKVVESFRERSSNEELQLTRRETEILDCLARGFSNKEIAGQLSLSVETVSWHLKQVYEKLHVHGRTEAAIKFLGSKAKPFTGTR